jgi:hypothetical protein
MNKPGMFETTAQAFGCLGPVMVLGLLAWAALVFAIVKVFT